LSPLSGRQPRHLNVRDGGAFLTDSLAAGSGTTGFGTETDNSSRSEAGDYMVVGPDWKGDTPAGIKQVFRSSTQFSLSGYRTQLFGPDDLDNVKKVQDGYKVQTLSAYLKETPPPAARTVDFPKIDKELVKTNFFDYLDFALQFAPTVVAQ
jgi:hypothetical protein